MKKFAFWGLVLTAVAVVVFLFAVLNITQLVDLSRRFFALAIWFCVLSLLSLLTLNHLVNKFDQKKLSLSHLLLGGMLELAILVFLVVAFILTLNGVPASVDVLVGTAPAASNFLGFLATVFTLWAAASSAFILFAQVHHEELSQALRRVNNQSEVLEEVRLWTENPNVERVAFFGAFSAIPGFWEEPISEAYTLIHNHIFEGNKPPFSLIGPDANSVRSLASSLAAPEQKKRLKEMIKWSEPARQLYSSTESDTADAINKIVEKYQELCNNLGGIVKVASNPWETSAITFAVAHDKYSNPIAAIFFGSPIPSDGLSPGEKINIFRKPLVYMSRREEIGSLLINLEHVIDENLANQKRGVA